jgi:hypothetical protein
MSEQPDEQVFQTDPRQVALLLDLEEGDDERLWSPDELAAVLRHQLSAPLKVDITDLSPSPASQLKTLVESQGLLLKSFADLLHHPNPPVEMLKKTKQFAKTFRLSPNSPIPRDIATVLYFASIAAGMTRCHRRISALGNDELLKGFEWVTGQSWVDGETKGLIEEARDLVEQIQGGRP